MTEQTLGGGRTAFRAGAGLAIVTGLLLSWMNAAVGIAGNEENPVNLSFYGLVATVMVAAWACEARARGLARALFCAAAMQMVLGAIVASGPVANGEPEGSLGLLALNGFFAALWFGASVFFTSAARAGHSRRLAAPRE